MTVFLYNTMKHIILITSLLLLSVSSNKPSEKELNTLLDNWHLAATNAQLENYFSMVTSDFVFLGTDPKERWLRDEFYTFCKPYFDKGKAWDFKPLERHWMFSENGKIAWFDERIDTWMKDCRGSGVVIKTKKGWKIAHYNLAVLIENEKTKSFIQLREGK